MMPSHLDVIRLLRLKDPKTEKKEVIRRLVMPARTLFIGFM